MKIAVKDIGENKREIDIEVGKDAVGEKFEQVLLKVSKEAKVAGFRQGNAPRDIIERDFSALIHEQVLKELIPDVYNQAIEQEGLDVLELPEISQVKLDRSGLSFKAKVELHPKINLPNYKGLKVNYKKVEVTPEEIKRHIEAIKETRRLEKIDEAFAKALGFPGVSELEQAVQAEIFLQKLNSERQKAESSVVEALAEEIKVALPSSLVKRQLEELLKQAKVNLAMRGMPKERIEQEEGRLRSELDPQAKRQVKVYLILLEIAKKENIAIDDSLPRRVIEFLLTNAEWNLT